MYIYRYGQCNFYRHNDGMVVKFTLLALLKV